MERVCHNSTRPSALRVSRCIVRLERLPHLPLTHLPLLIPPLPPVDPTVQKLVLHLVNIAVIFNLLYNKRWLIRRATICVREGALVRGGGCSSTRAVQQVISSTVPGLQYVVLDWLMSDSRPSLCPLQIDECINYIL